MGHQDLNDTLLAAGVALAIVWGCLVLRYGVAGLLGLYLCIVYIWCAGGRRRAACTHASAAAAVQRHDHAAQPAVAHPLPPHMLLFPSPTLPQAASHLFQRQCLRPV